MWFLDISPNLEAADRNVILLPCGKEDLYGLWGDKSLSCPRGLTRGRPTYPLFSQRTQIQTL